MSATISDPRDRGGPRQPQLEVAGLTKHFPLRGGLLNTVRATVHAVDDVFFALAKGEVLGVVGESGCGKSTTARLLMHLIPADRGSMVFDGELVGGAVLPVKALRQQMQMVFQDSFSSLNPPPSRAWIRAAAPPWPRSPATRRTRSIRRPAAASTRAARSRNRSARPACRSCAL
jgi:peptide/nickel transport system ATP-binding protein